MSFTMKAAVTAMQRAARQAASPGIEWVSHAIGSEGLSERGGFLRPGFRTEHSLR